LAGQQTEYPSGNVEEKLNEYSWYWGNSSRGTNSVGGKNANKFGIYDTYGNVAEMTADCFNPNYSNAPTTSVAWLGGLCVFRVVRGGSWSEDAIYLRSKSRSQINVKNKVDTIGFRVARDLLK
jgi:formylglycine-generating enzyme required for sulfatase activity